MRHRLQFCFRAVDLAAFPSEPRSSFKPCIPGRYVNGFEFPSQILISFRYDIQAGLILSSSFQKKKIQTRQAGMENDS